jgi:hypothetical protein
MKARLDELQNRLEHHEATKGSQHVGDIKDSASPPPVSSKHIPMASVGTTQVASSAYGIPSTSSSVFHPPPLGDNTSSSVFMHPGHLISHHGSITAAPLASPYHTPPPGMLHHQQQTEWCISQTSPGNKVPEGVAPDYLRFQMHLSSQQDDERTEKGMMPLESCPSIRSTTRAGCQRDSKSPSMSLCFTQLS